MTEAAIGLLVGIALVSLTFGVLPELVQRRVYKKRARTAPTLEHYWDDNKECWRTRYVSGSKK